MVCRIFGAQLTSVLTKISKQYEECAQKFRKCPKSIYSLSLRRKGIREAETCSPG